VSSTHSFRVIHKFRIVNSVSRTRNIDMVSCKAYFDILNHLGVTDECDARTDGRTDILVANAALILVGCAAGAPPQTQLWKLRALPQTP